MAASRVNDPRDAAAPDHLDTAFAEGPAQDVAPDAAVPASVRPSHGGGEPVTRSIGAFEEARRLAGLKWRVLINTLTRSTWILVGTILGGLYALFLLGMALTALIALGGEALETVVVASVLLGSLLLVGWWLVPLVSSKADSTLDPSRLALFPLSTTGLVAGQVAGAVVGIPGVLTVIALLGWLFSWRGSTVALIAAIPCAIIGALLAFVGSRCVTALGANFAKGRRTNEIISMVVLVLVVLLGPLISLFATGLGQVWQLLPTWAGVLAWTPLGATWAVPGDVASGHWLAALARVAISLVTLLLLVVVTCAGLRRALGDAAGGAARGTSRPQEGVGLFDRFPANQWGAVAARCLTYWLKDPRYSASLLMIPAIGAVFWFIAGESGLSLWALPLFVSLLMAYAISADVSYDNTAFSLHVLAPVSGRADRLGRVVALLIVAVPLVLLSIVLWLVGVQRWDALPAVVGVCVGILLGGAGVVSIVSARYTYPTPPPGASPMKTPQGFTILNLVVQFVIMGLMALLALPAGILLIVYLVTGAAVWCWLALAVGLVEGFVVLWIGVRSGGKWLDARGPELLQEVAAYR